jgi:hypothetical protein
MLTQASYPAINLYPVTGPVIGPTRALNDQATGVKVTLSGPDFSARIQVSNAVSDGRKPDHLFVPEETSWDTVATLGPTDPPENISGPVRYCRVILDSGTLTGGNIAESKTQGGQYGTQADTRQIVSAAIVNKADTVDLQAQAVKLDGVRAITTPAEFVAGVPEEPTQGAKQILPQRIETRLYGIGMNAAVQSVSNLPGSRTLVNAVSTLAELGPFGFDFAGVFVNFEVSAALYAVPTGAATFTASTFAVSGLGSLDPLLLRPGTFVRTTHPEQWYAPITAVNLATGVVTVKEWRKRTDGTLGTPANGTGAIALINPIDKAFLRNGVLGFTADSPTRTGVYDEADIYIAGGDAAARGFDITVLGDNSNSTEPAYKVRSAPGAGGMRYAFAALDAVWDTMFYSGPNAANPTATRPQWDARFERGTSGNMKLKGDVVHLRCESASGAEVFQVAADGSLRVQQKAFGPSAPAANTASGAAGATPTQAEFNALLDELRTLKNLMRNAGLLLI